MAIEKNAAGGTAARDERTETGQPAAGAERGGLRLLETEGGGTTDAPPAKDQGKGPVRKAKEAKDARPGRKAPGRAERTPPKQPEREGRAAEPEPSPEPAPQPEPKAAKAPPKIAPPASRARARPRHLLALSSLLIIVLLPAAATAWYLWDRAADQYASYVGFSVRTEEAGSAIEMLGGITELSGSSSSDTDILYEFLQSQSLVRQIDQEIDLRGIWSKPGFETDPIFVYDPPGTIEDLEAHWADMVRISYDGGSGLIDLRVLAFDPEDAQLIGSAIFEASSAMINELTDVAREDAVRYAREELDTAVERLKQARSAIQEFRNRTQIVDPTIDTAGQMGLVTNLQGQLAEAIIELDMLTGTTRAGDPRISQAERRIEVIEQRIDSEREKVGLGEGGEGRAIADLVGEYEVLTVDRQFAEQSYTAALAAYDAAQAEARRQTRYLAAHVRPTLAERSDFPQRGMLLSFVTLFLALGWAIAVLVAYALRDRR